MQGDKAVTLTRLEGYGLVESSGSRSRGVTVQSWLRRSSTAGKFHRRGRRQRGAMDPQRGEEGRREINF